MRRLAVSAIAASVSKLIKPRPSRPAPPVDPEPAKGSNTMDSGPGAAEDEAVLGKGFGPAFVAPRQDVPDFEAGVLNSGGGAVVPAGLGKA